MSSLNSGSTDDPSMRIIDWALRLALSTAFLAAVADRLGFCGPIGTPNVSWGAWPVFVDYTGKLLFFLPAGLVQISAVLATAAETIFGVWLLTGLKLRIVAYASSALLLTFAVSMVIALGWKAPFNYSVFVDAAAALALGALHSPSAKDTGRA